MKSIKKSLAENYSESQFGFRPKSSTQRALISFHENRTRYLDDRETRGAMIIAYEYAINRGCSSLCRYERGFSEAMQLSGLCNYPICD